MPDARPTAIVALQNQIAELLDQALVRHENGYAAGKALRSLHAAWRDAGGDPEGSSLLVRAEGTLGMVNASPPPDPLAAKAMADLIALKQELRKAVAAARDAR